jgi:hypothetical protein
MAPSLRNSLIFAATINAAICVAATSPASAVVFDLQTDWSDTSNPNGPWSYREVNTLLIQHPNWSGFGPAWSNGTSGVTTPMLLQYDGVGSEGIDALPGDIVGHTANSGNQTVIRFVNTVAGLATISGNVWDAHSSQDRDAFWIVQVNGISQDSGAVADPGNGRDARDFFSFVIALAVNDVVELRSGKQPGEAFGSLLGYNITIDITPSAAVVPLPGALPLFGSVVAGFLGFKGWRRRRERSAANA